MQTEAIYIQMQGRVDRSEVDHVNETEIVLATGIRINKQDYQAWVDSTDRRECYLAVGDGNQHEDEHRCGRMPWPTYYWGPYFAADVREYVQTKLQRPKVLIVGCDHGIKWNSEMMRGFNQFKKEALR